MAEDSIPNIEKEDNYISWTATLDAEDGTNYEYWVYRTRIVRTGKYKVGGHITVQNRKIRLYDVRDRTTIENISTKELADRKTELLKQEFEDKILGYASKNLTEE